MYGRDTEPRGVALWITCEEADALLRVLREAAPSARVPGETVKRLRCRLAQAHRSRYPAAPRRLEEGSYKALDCAG